MGNKNSTPKCKSCNLILEEYQITSGLCSVCKFAKELSYNHSITYTRRNQEYMKSLISKRNNKVVTCLCDK